MEKADNHKGDMKASGKQALKGREGAPMVRSQPAEDRLQTARPSFFHRHHAGLILSFPRLAVTCLEAMLTG